MSSSTLAKIWKTNIPRVSMTNQATGMRKLVIYKRPLWQHFVNLRSLFLVNIITYFQIKRYVLGAIAPTLIILLIVNHLLNTGYQFEFDMIIIAAYVAFGLFGMVTLDRMVGLFYLKHGFSFTDPASTESKEAGKVWKLNAGKIAEQPKTVKTAISLLWVSVAAGVVLEIVSYFNNDFQLCQTLASSNNDDATKGILIITVLVIPLALITLMYLLLAILIYKISCGTNWARIALSAITALIVAAFIWDTFFDASQPSSTLFAPLYVTEALSLIKGLLLTSSVILLFLQGSEVYFARPGKT